MREPSHVLRAMQVPAAYAPGTVRFSLGRGTTDAQIDRVLDLLPRVLEGLRRPGLALAK
jgi:cysteine desulfurase